MWCFDHGICQVLNDQVIFSEFRFCVKMEEMIDVSFFPQWQKLLHYFVVRSLHHCRSHAMVILF